MKVLPLHDIPPVRKPKVLPTFTPGPPRPESQALDYAPRRVGKRDWAPFRWLRLLEIFMVSYIVFIVAGVVLPRMADRGDVSSRDPATTDLPALEGAIDQFELDTGRLPTNAEGLNALHTPPASLPTWHGPYLIHAPKDPWGHLYTYRRLPFAKFELRCAGPNGKPNTPDDIVRTCVSPQ